jgi:hypothetical protein
VHGRTDDELVFACRPAEGGASVACPVSSRNPTDRNPTEKKSGSTDGSTDASTDASKVNAADLVIVGGYQECRGASIGSNQFYVENVQEELDDDREWFVNGVEYSR